MAKLVAPAQLRHLKQLHDGDAGVAASVAASLQLGVITFSQLQLLGMGRGMIRHRLGDGSLHRVFRGVFLLGHAVPPPGALEVAALLACDLKAVISHRSAAALWGLADAPVDQVEVIATAGHRRSRQALEVHRTDWLPRTHLRRHRGLPVTSPARTLIDLAAGREPGLERAVAEAQVLRLIAQPQLAAELAGAPPYPGIARLRQLIANDSRGFTRSEAERIVRHLCRQADLPAPQSNVRVCGWEVDLLWPEHKLVVEVDGFAAHGHRQAFERDRRKQTDLVAAGLRVIRLTWMQLQREPLAVIAALARALTPVP